MSPDRREGINHDPRPEDAPSIGSRLGQLSARIGELTSQSGLFYVVCARTSVRPAPVAAQRFGTRRLAEEAAVCATNYRAVLRELDQSLPVYDLVANEATTGAHWLDTTPEHAQSVQSSRREWEPVPDSDYDARIDFCHALAGVVFEALSTAGYRGVDRECRATMDRVAGADERCLTLLAALDAQLDDLAANARATVLRTAAGRLARSSAYGDPIEATLERLQSVDLLETYEIGRRGPEATGTTRSVEATLTGYALGANDGTAPRLPITVDLLRRRPDLPISSLRMTRLDDQVCRLELPTTQ
ncbi:MAG: hypothetical protein R3324_07965, partial [Halobacteriales archaeon]|nr:hypothetical protein [Halobacteriales archaeon]